MFSGICSLSSRKRSQSLSRMLSFQQHVVCLMFWLRPQTPKANNSAHLGTCLVFLPSTCLRAYRMPHFSVLGTAILAVAFSFQQRFVPRVCRPSAVVRHRSLSVFLPYCTLYVMPFRQHHLDFHRR